MLENHMYNLEMQLVKESQSLWRMKEMYMSDSDCDQCRGFWEDMIEQKEETITQIQQMINDHQEQEEKVSIPA